MLKVGQIHETVDPQEDSSPLLRTCLRCLPLYVSVDVQLQSSSSIEQDLSVVTTVQPHDYPRGLCLEQFTMDKCLGPENRRTELVSGPWLRQCQLQCRKVCLPYRSSLTSRQKDNVTFHQLSAEIVALDWIYWSYLGTW